MHKGIHKVHVIQRSPACITCSCTHVGVSEEDTGKSLIMQAFGAQTESSLQGKGKLICYDRGYKHLKSAILQWGFDVLSTEQRTKDFPFAYDVDSKKLDGRKLVGKKGAPHAQTAVRMEQHGNRKVRMLAMAWRNNGQVTLMETSLPELVANPAHFTAVTKSRDQAVLEQTRLANGGEPNESSDTEGSSTDIDSDEDEMDQDDPDSELHFFPGIEVVPAEHSTDDEELAEPASQRARVPDLQQPLPPDTFHAHILSLHARVRAEHANKPAKVQKHIAALDHLCSVYTAIQWQENLTAEMDTVIQLTVVQATPAWFAMRVGVFTSSVAHSVMSKTLPLLHCTDNKVIAASARVVADFVEKALDAALDMDDFVYKTDEELEPKKVTVEILDSHIDVLNIARVQMALAKIKKAGKKQEKIDRVKAAQLEMQTKQAKQENGDDRKAHIQTCLIKTWFMKRVDDKKCASLTIGRNNEKYIQQYVGIFLYRYSQRYMVLDQKELGLVERRDRPYICTSTDALIWLADLDNVEGDACIVAAEFKTVTTTDTIGQAKRVRLDVGKFMHCTGRSKGTYVEFHVPCI